MDKIYITVSQIKIGSLAENIDFVKTTYERILNKKSDLLVMPAYTLSDNFLPITENECVHLLTEISKMTQGKTLSLLLGIQKFTDPEIYLFKDGTYNKLKSHFTVCNFLIAASTNEISPILGKDIAILFETSKKTHPEFSGNLEAAIYVNQVGSKDDLIFNGESLIVTKELNKKMASWEQDEKSFVLENKPSDQSESQIETEQSFVSENKLSDNYLIKNESRIIVSIEESISDLENLYRGLVFSVKNHLLYNNFTGALLGMSGGIDSALTGYIAVAALGSENVKAFMLPSMYTSSESIKDAYDCCKNLSIQISSIPIKGIYESFMDALSTEFSGYPPDVTEENIQSRIRGTLLMSLSNKTGHMLLATGNKSESCVGYCTLYGDTCGGFAPIKHIYKTDVYNLANFINDTKKIKIPDNIIAKAPTAELKSNQKDQDTLPPYEQLDLILKVLLDEEKNLGYENISPINDKVIEFVRRQFKKSEYKRLQSAPGAKFSRRKYDANREFI